MPFEEKIKEKADFIRIYGDKEEQDRLGIHGVAEISEYAGISHVLGHKLVNRGETRNGDFDLKGFLGENKEIIAKKLLEMVKAGKTVRSIELALRSLGELVEKREDTLTIEYTSDQITNNAERFIGHLRESLETDGGICPVCGKSNLLLDEVRNN